MRRWQPLAVILSLFVSVSAGAADTDGAKPVPSGHHHPRHSAADVHRRVARHESEVRQLQQDVARQESASRQANERLQQQDQAIAELQKQLQEVHAKPATDQH
jgi:hypothetical protein